MDRILFFGYEFLSSFIPFLWVLIGIRNLRKKREIPDSGAARWLVIAFAIYVIGVCHFTGAGTLYDALTYRLEIRRDQLNIIPFSHEIDGTAYLLNILLFVPLGLFIQLIWKRMDGWRHVLETGFLFAVLIEVSQLLNNRRTDIDDLILNVAGAAIGYALYRAWDPRGKTKNGLGGAIIAELPIYMLVLFAGRFLFFYEIGWARWMYGF